MDEIRPPQLAGVPEQDDIALLDDVVLAFETHLSFFARGAEAAGPLRRG